MFKRLLSRMDRNRLVVAGAAGLAFILIIIIIIFSACNADEAAEQSPSPDIVSETPPPTPSPTPATEIVYIGTVAGVDSFLNIRDSSTRSGNIIGKATPGEQFTVLNQGVGDDANWHQILYNGAAAYVHKDYLVIEERIVEILP